MNKVFLATFTLLGGIFGAGFLGIPYVIRGLGFPLGFLEILVISLFLLVFLLYVSDFIFKSKGNHQFTGYAGKYFGSLGKHIMFFAFAIGLYSAIVAYLIGEGQSLSFLFFKTLDYQLIFGILFWLVLSLLVYLGLKALEGGEAIGVGLVLIIVILITLSYGSKIQVENLMYSNVDSLVVPLGVIFFALMNFSGIPIIKEIIGQDKKAMKKSIVYAYIISFITYSLFTLVVFGFKGKEVPEIATLALGGIFIILGIITIFTSSFSSSMALRETWIYDWKRKRTEAWAYTVFPPLIIFVILSLTGFAGFTKVINIGVIVSGGLITLFLIALMIKEKLESR